MRTFFLRAVGLALGLFITGAASAAPLPYEFAIDPPSGANFQTVSLTAKTSGSLIGNWDPLDNPTGTRTKPGLFGTFGDTENLPVNTSLNFAASGSPVIPLGGSFGMQIDTAANTLVMSNYLSTISGPPNGKLGLSATLLFDTFRTRSPTSTFIGGVPVTLPLGDAMITSLSIEQVDPAAPGTLTATGPGEYSFVTAPLVNISGIIDLQGSLVAFGPIAAALPMQGTVTLSGDDAALTALAPLDLADTQYPNLVLPPIPFDLPTILPTGEIAHVIFNLTLNEVISILNGTITTTATGSVVPEPAAATLALLATAVCTLRRRRC
jgi:hypothetical protein